MTGINLDKKAKGIDPEGFKTIPGFEKLYCISEAGDIITYIEEEEVETTSSSWGPKVKLDKRGVISSHLVFNLIARTYVKKENPEFDHVYHLDGDKSNYLPSNLGWRFKPATVYKNSKKDIHKAAIKIAEAYMGSKYKSKAEAAKELKSELSLILGEGLILDIIKQGEKN